MTEREREPGQTQLIDHRRRFYNQAEVAAIFGVHNNTIARWCDEGRLPLIRIGRRKFIDRDAVDRLCHTGRGNDDAA